MDTADPGLLEKPSPAATQAECPEPTDIELLHSISVALIGEKNIEALYLKILDAAVAIMGSQFASMQMLHPDRGPPGGLGELKLLSARGYTEAALKQFEWVGPDMTTSCGTSLRSGQRTILPNVETCDELGAELRTAFLDTGIRSMQTTPLVSRSGQLLGMITTHWSEPHEPSNRDLRLMDILARQAADLLERTQAEATLTARERQLEGILGAVTDAFMSVDHAFRFTFANERYASRFDKTQSDLVGKTIWDVLPEAVGDLMHFELNRAMRSRAVAEYEVYDEASDRWFSEKAFPTADGGLAVYSQDITDRKRAEKLRQMLTGELSHRVKNMLATVQAIATQTLRRSTNSKEFVKSFGGRIQSMSRVHSQLSNNEWQGAALRDIVRDQIQDGPIDETRVTATGPDVRLDAQIVPQVAMMLHELGTNSIKYGALSTPAGTIAITWTVGPNALHMLWQERGGPTVQVPLKRGLGTTLIEQSAKGAGGEAHMLIDASGVKWEITLALPQASDAKAAGIAPPLAKKAPVAVETSATAHKLLAGRRFLVIEDEPLVAMEIVDLLEDAGAEVVGSTGHVADALKLAETSEVDAALLDANLAGQPVDDIAAALTRKGVAFAYVTGYARETLPVAFANATLLSKPFSQQQLIDTASELVSERADVLSMAEKRR